jgi:hypothetical protein
MAQRNYRADGSHATLNDARIEISDGNFSLGIMDGIQGMSIKQSQDYGEEREVGSVFVEDFTTGDYSADGSLDAKAENWDRFRTKLAAKGKGYFGVPFNITWTYKKKDGNMTTITATRVLFSSHGRDAKVGNEALKVAIEFKIFGRVYEDGVDAFGGRL